MSAGVAGSIVICGTWRRLADDRSHAVFARRRIERCLHRCQGSLDTGIGSSIRIDEVHRPRGTVQQAAAPDGGVIEVLDEVFDRPHVTLDVGVPTNPCYQRFEPAVWLALACTLKAPPYVTDEMKLDDAYAGGPTVELGEEGCDLVIGPTLGEERWQVGEEGIEDVDADVASPG